MATLHELDTVYGVEDCCDMLEVATVNARNRRALARRQEERD